LKKCNLKKIKILAKMALKNPDIGQNGGQNFDCQQLGCQSKL